MRNRLIGAVATLLAGGSLALAQPSPSDSAPLADQAEIAEEAAPVEESETAEPTEMAGQPEKSEPLNIRPRAVNSDLPRVVISEPSSPSEAEVVANGPVEEGPAELSGPACEASACCPSGGAPCCDSNCRFYGSVEALFWWIKDSNVSTGTNLRIVDSSAAGNDDKVDNKERVGGRFTAGYWVDDYRTFAVEATYLFLGSRSVDSSTAPTSLRIVNTDVTVPGRERTLSSRLEGWEANVRAHALDDSPFGVDLIAGFRNLQVNEGLGIRLNQAVGGVPGVGIGASNDFFGGQVGACASYRNGPLSVDVLGKIALGCTHEDVDLNISGVPVSAHSSHDRFAAVPEADVILGYAVTDHIRATLGYTFLYNSDVVRPGDQVAPLLGGTLVGQSLLFSPESRDFWAQGLDLGLEFHY